MNDSAPAAASLAVDAHVHLYDCFDPCHFCDAAFGNLSGAQPAETRYPHANVLLLTETPRESGFMRLLEASSAPGQPVCSGGSEDWFCHPTGEDSAVRLQSASGRTLWIIAGRQIVVQEGLEVHALATGRVYEDGMPLRQLIDAIKANGDIAALPWGAGKWLGQRGRILSESIDDFIDEDVLLSDSGIRPWFWTRPELFRSGARIITGTDPLPVPAEAARTGSFGFTVVAQWDENRPATAMRSLLGDRDLVYDCFGRSQGAWQFFSRQIAIRT